MVDKLTFMSKPMRLFLSFFKANNISNNSMHFTNQLYALLLFTICNSLKHVFKHENHKAKENS